MALPSLSLRTCRTGRGSLSGRPDVALVGHDGNGSELVRFTAVPAEGGFMLSSSPGAEVVLTPGGTAFFGIEDEHICPPNGSGPLVPIDQAEVTVNGESPFNSPIDLRMTTCGGAGVGVFRSSIGDVGP